MRRVLILYTSFISINFIPFTSDALIKSVTFVLLPEKYRVSITNELKAHLDLSLFQFGSDESLFSNSWLLNS